MKIYHYLYIAIMACLPSLSSFAVKATPNSISHTQSNGTVIQYKIHGDEQFSYRTTLDNFLLAHSSNGDLHYASLSNDGITPSLLIAHNQESRPKSDLRFLKQNYDNTFASTNLIETAKQISSSHTLSRGIQPKFENHFPLYGSPKSLIILVNFTDKKFVTENPNQAFTNLLNQKDYSDNGATGSARDYFISSSFGQFSPTFDVVGPIELPKSASYYGQNSQGGYTDLNVRNMIIEACSIANEQVDFSIYDTDSDGIVDNIFVYYAGHNEAEGGGDNSIWPHRSTIIGSMRLDGVKLEGYACTSELKNSYGTAMCGIGTFAHEFGHVLGLPDFYPTYGSSNHPTLEKWDIMDNGSYNNAGRTPPTYSSYERFFLGWLTPDTILNGQTVVEPLIQSNKAYIVSASPHNMNGANPDPIEFFMIENRQRIGWDEKALPGEGLLVQHIYYNASTWNNNTPNNDPNNMGVQIVHADGTFDNLPGDTYPGSLNVTRCILNSKSGTQVGKDLLNIRQIGTNISFQYGEIDKNSPYIINKNELSTFTSPEDTASATQILDITAHKISSSITITSKNNNASIAFRIKGSVSDFSDSICIPASTDSIVNLSLEIICTPRITTYDETITSFLNIESEEYFLSVPFQWKSPRPIYIVTPTATEATDVSPYQFIANWNEVFDATAYYITAYYIKQEKGEKLEQFSSFDKQAPTNWRSNFNRVSRYYYASSPLAVSFRNTNDTLVSEQFFSPANNISFWTMSDNVAGNLYVDAFNGESWQQIKTIPISFATQNIVNNIPLDTKHNYIQFRFSFNRTSEEGYLYFDNFKFSSTTKQEFIADNIEVRQNHATFSSLNPNIEYFYKVTATDKDFEKNKYCNITDFSNTISVTTPDGFDREDKRITIKRLSDGRYACYLETWIDCGDGLGDLLHIYDIHGQLQAEINITSFETILPELAPNNIYIVKLLPTGSQCGEIKMSRKTKVVKFYYIE